jgi:hypothetical protein
MRPGLLAVLAFVAGLLAGPAGAQEGGAATPNVWCSSSPTTSAGAT